MSYPDFNEAAHIELNERLYDLFIIHTSAELEGLLEAIKDYPDKVWHETVLRVMTEILERREGNK